MNNPTSQSQSTRRSPILWALAGFSVLFVCVLLACIASVGFWLLGARDTGVAQAPASEVSRAERGILPPGDAEAGEQLFSGEAGCSACHSLEPGVRLVGPSLAGVAERAEAAGESSTEAYLYESIVDPKAIVVEGYSGNIMPENYGRRFSDQQLADLVAFLMTR